MERLAFCSATQLAAAIRTGQVGCRELLDAYLARVERYNPSLNAIVVMDIEGAQRRADAADVAVKRGEFWGPLHGVPMTVKESLDVTAMPTTWGVPELARYFPERNAAAVDRMLAAGAVLFGKTNVPYLLGDWQSYNAIYGTTNNPWNLALSPGGSSGGAAAALAAGLTGIEVGSDIGGSLRNPAHYCGIYSHKPSYGLCQTRGHAIAGRIAPSDLSVLGPLARSVDDLETVLRVLAGPDAIDAVGWRYELPAPKGGTLADYRVAMMADDAVAEVDEEVRVKLAALAEFLRRNGVAVDERARPDIDTHEALQVFVQLVRAATSIRLTDEAFARQVSLAGDLSAADGSYRARALRGTVLRHREWLQADERRHVMRQRWAAFFEDYDVLLTPVAATAAVPHDREGERHQRTIPINGKKMPVTDQVFWAGFPALGELPATVAPIGLSARGLPIGVQIVTRKYGDLNALHFARLLERDYCRFTSPPNFD